MAKQLQQVLLQSFQIPAKKINYKNKVIKIIELFNFNCFNIILAGRLILSSYK